MSTLRFAERVKKVQNKARINIDPHMLKYVLPSWSTPQLFILHKHELTIPILFYSSRIIDLEEQIRRLQTSLSKCICAEGTIPTLPPIDPVTTSLISTQTTWHEHLCHQHSQTANKITHHAECQTPKKGWWESMVVGTVETWEKSSEYFKRQGLTGCKMQREADVVVQTHLRLGRRNEVVWPDNEDQRNHERLASKLL
jgi:hypothetical protein